MPGHVAATAAHHLCTQGHVLYSIFGHLLRRYIEGGHSIHQVRQAGALTEKGIKWMEQAAKQGLLDRSALAVPYNNLAAMHRKLGSADLADRYQEMASRTKKETLK